MTFDIKAAKGRSTASLNILNMLPQPLDLDKEYEGLTADEACIILAKMNAKIVEPYMRMYEGDKRPLFEHTNADKLRMFYLECLYLKREYYPGFTGDLYNGERYEQAFIDYCHALDIRGERYKQIYIPKDDHALGRENMMQRWQRDAWICTADNRRLNVEIKSLTSASKWHSGYLVGAIGKWDNKRFPVHICVIILQETGDIFWTRASKADVKKWLIVESKQRSYLVPFALMKPFKDIIKPLGYML